MCAQPQAAGPAHLRHQRLELRVRAQHRSRHPARRGPARLARACGRTRGRSRSSTTDGRTPRASPTWRGSPRRSAAAASARASGFVPCARTQSANSAWLLPDARFGKGAPHDNLAFDPTVPEAREAALATVRQAVGWGYGFIKHDFSNYGSCSAAGATRCAPKSPAPPGAFMTRLAPLRRSSRTSIVRYDPPRATSTTILGCNTMGHLAAGVFDSQRVADDTSGHDWERTRRYGVNGLAHRIAQHRTFYHVDPDCVAITPQVGWRETSQWMDVVARSRYVALHFPRPARCDGGRQSGHAGCVCNRGSKWLRQAPYIRPRRRHRSNGASTLRGAFRKTYNWMPAEGVTPYDV